MAIGSRKVLMFNWNDTKKRTKENLPQTFCPLEVLRTIETVKGPEDNRKM